MKKLARFVAEGEMTTAAFCEQYKSWRGDKERYNAHRTLAGMDSLYGRLLQWTKSRPTP